MLTPSHLQNSRSGQPNSPSKRAQGGSSSHDEGDASSPIAAHVSQQYVIIDIRSYEDTALSGAGVLPRAIQFEPEFLNRPEAFNIWLQHFDGTRGCNIVILDMPEVKFTGVNLWRRLLLGEGDGALKYSKLLDHYDFGNIKENKKRLDALIAQRKSQKTTETQPRDKESKYYMEEEEILLSDLNSPAMILAIVLQRASFNKVSILEGGFPALIHQLISTKGKVEPVVVEHEPQKWVEYLKNTGRYHDYNLLSSASSSNAQKIAGKLKKNQSITASVSSVDEESERIMNRKEQDLTPLERYEFALAVAERLQHATMAQILKDRIQLIKEAEL
jgi:hypothetical protein